MGIFLFNFGGVVRRRVVVGVVDFVIEILFFGYDVNVLDVMLCDFFVFNFIVEEEVCL